MSIESASDLAAMKRVGAIVADVLAEMCSAVRAGMTTAALDRVGAAALARNGARSAPQLEYGFPAATCISVNDEIVHGIPGARALRPGDVVKIDVTAERGGYVADSATTVIVGDGLGTGHRLQVSARAALDAALAVARAGSPISLIGRAIEQHVRADGFHVLRELCGHGVGRHIHEEPSVLNYEDAESRDVLTEGLVIAIEPMIAARPSRAVQRRDGWTIATHNGCIAAHEEHTVVIRHGEPVVLTAR